MSKFNEWIATKYQQIESQAVKAIETTNFYGNLFTSRQKLYILFTFMGMMFIAGAHGAVQFVGLIYIMSKLTPEDKND